MSNRHHRAALFDVDGTLMLNTSGRSFYDWDRVGEDSPNAAVVELALNLIEAQRLEIVVVSGRDEICRQATADSLEAQGVFYAELIMRPHKDNRPDEIVKRELYDKHIKPFYDVAFVVDDRAKVVAMWRELGLTCFQVAPGNF